MGGSGKKKGIEEADAANTGRLEPRDEFQSATDEYGRTLGEIPRLGVTYLEQEADVPMDLTLVFFAVTVRLLEFHRKIPLPSRALLADQRLSVHPQLRSAALPEDGPHPFLASALPEPSSELPASLTSLEPFAKGGFANVSRALWRGEQNDLSRPLRVVVKKIPMQTPADQAHNEAEYSVLAHASHPSIVKLYAAYSVLPGPELWLVMEWVDGLTLRAMLHPSIRPLAADLVLGIAPALFGALAHLHSRNVVHCDIKPENVVVSTAGDVRVIDFGLARHSDLCVQGEMLGSAYWMAPEMVRGEAYGPPADIYSACRSLLCAYLGGVRDHGKSFRCMFAAAACNPAYYYADALAVAGSSVGDLLLRGLSPKPADRPTAQDLLEGFAQFSPSASVLSKKLRSVVKKATSWLKKRGSSGSSLNASE